MDYQGATEMLFEQKSKGRESIILWNNDVSRGQSQSQDPSISYVA